jgi:hypothetical protein
MGLESATGSHQGLRLFQWPEDGDGGASGLVSQGLQEARPEFPGKQQGVPERSIAHQLRPARRNAGSQASITAATKNLSGR